MKLRSLTEVRNEHCKECPLHETAEYVCLTGFGQVPSDILIIGEAPGKREDDSGVPFVGKAGKILNVILDECGLSRAQVYITNIVHCRPPDNRKPTMSEIRACRPYLIKEIQRIHPDKIIVLGDVALKGLFDTNTVSIGRERGKILDFTYTTRLVGPDGERVKKTAKVIITYHPSAANYKKVMANYIYEDIKNGIDKSSGIIVKNKSKYQLVDRNNIQSVVKRLHNLPLICIDIETSSLDYMDKKAGIRSFNLSIVPGESWVFKPEHLSYIKDILYHKELVINHNIKFDLEWLNRYGIKRPFKIFDTLVAKHLLDENCPDKELERLGITELGMEEEFREKDKMKHHWKDGTDPTWEELRICGLDSDASLRLYHKYAPQLKEEGLDKLMSAEMKVLKTLIRMELFGFKIDTKVHKDLTEEYAEKIRIGERTIQRLVGTINLNSPKQLTQLLYHDMKLPVLIKTQKQSPSCNEAALKLLLLKTHKQSYRDILRALLDFRGVSKLYNTYLVGLTKNDLLKDDGKVHCDFKITGTVTGRLSCADPNLENIPREGDIKKMFISSFPKGYIIQADYSQIELRVLAHYSNDPNLIRAFEQGRDIHKEVAAKVFHKRYDDVTDKERKFTKQVNFGIVYLISPPGLADKLGCSIPEASQLISEWFHEFPRAREWIAERKESIINTGKSISLTGRVRRLYGVDPETREGREAIRQGVNSPIQGGAGDITKYNMHRLDYSLKDDMESRVINNVHDAVMVDSPTEEEVIECISRIHHLFKEAPVKMRVPLGVEIKVGRNWRDLVKVENLKDLKKIK